MSRKTQRSFPTLLARYGAMEVMSDLEEFEVIETALVGFESSSHRFDLSPDVDEKTEEKNHSVTEESFVDFLERPFMHTGE